MSGCADVCLDHEYDETNDFYCERAVIARKPHVCCECGGAIPRGTQYQLARGKADGSFWVAKTCVICYEIRRAFVCGSWQFGQLWESIEEGIFPVWNTHGPIDCLAKLETREARAAAMDRYREWAS